MQSTVDSGLFRGCGIWKCGTAILPSPEESTHVLQSQSVVSRIAVAEPVHLFDDIGSQDLYARQAEIR